MKRLVYRCAYTVGFFALVSLAGCGEKAESKRQKKTQVEAPKDLVTPDFGIKSATPENIAAIRQKIEGQFNAFDMCTRQGNCEQVAVKFQKKDPQEGAPVIMIIDSGESIPAVVRYGSRVLNWFQVNEENALVEEVQPSYSMSAQAKVILSDILDKAPYHISQRDTQSLFSAFSKRFSNEVRPPAEEHLNNIFNIIAEYVPNARFVIVNMSSIAPFSKESFCRMNLQDKEVIRQRISSIGDGVRRISSSYGVSFINFSMGFGLEQASQGFDTYCPEEKAPQKMQDYADLGGELADKLGTIDGTILVQAGYTSSVPLSVDDRRAPGDCHPISNRIRIGYIMSKDSGLSPNGNRDGTLTPFPRDLVPGFQNTVWPCLDLLVNSGFEFDSVTDEKILGTTPFNVSRYGIDFRPWIPEMTTSWATPLGLAHLTYIQARASLSGRGKLTRDELLMEAMGGRPDSHKVIDPLRNAQFIRASANHSVAQP